MGLNGFDDRRPLGEVWGVWGVWGIWSDWGVRGDRGLRVSPLNQQANCMRFGEIWLPMPVLGYVEVRAG